MERAYWSEKRFAGFMMLGVFFLASLIVYAVLEYPASMLDGGSWSVVIAIGLLFAYATVGWLVWHHASIALRKALTIGTIVGCIFGIAEMANISIESSAYAAREIVPPLVMALMPVFFGVAACVTEELTGSWRIAVFGGVWCGLIGSLIACIFGLASNLVTSPQAGLISANSVQTSSADLGAVVMRNTLESASSHLGLIPLLAVILSCVGALTRVGLRRLRRPAVIALAMLAVLLVASSVGTIHFALSLARPERPPFIASGMLVAAIALTCLWPMLSSLRKQRFDGLECTGSRMQTNG